MYKKRDFFKFLILFLVIIITIPLPVITQEISLNEDFDEYSPGTFPTGWIRTTPSAFITNTLSNSIPNSLKIVNSSVWRELGIPEKINKIEYSFYIALGKMPSNFVYTKLTYENKEIKITFDYRDNTIKVRDIKIGTWGANEWRKLTLKVDLASDKFDVYLDNALKASSLELIPLTISLPQRKLKIEFIAEPGTTMYVDDVKLSGIVESPPPPPPPTKKGPEKPVSPPPILPPILITLIIAIVIIGGVIVIALLLIRRPGPTKIEKPRPPPKVERPPPEVPRAPPAAPSESAEPTVIAKRCPSCGTLNPQGALFCKSCGARLD